MRMLCAILFFFCAGQIRAGEAPTLENNSGRIFSEVLIVEARAMMAEIYTSMKAERRLPPDITNEQLAARTTASIDQLKAAHIFDVSALQDEAFKKDKFDDAKNLEQLGDLIKYLKSSGIDLPAQVVFAMRHYEAKDLKRARLEMCTRVVSYSVAKIRALLGDGEAPAKRSKL